MTTNNIPVFGFQDYLTNDVIQTIDLNNHTAPTEAWEIAFTEGGMPTLTVPLSERKSGIGYLTPFRCYRFQVSGTFNGDGDYGSTIVATDLYRLTELGELGAKALTEMAENAIVKATGLHRIPIKAQAYLDAFISLCYEYLQNKAESLKKIYA
jgi:hypothetical protein